MTATTLRAQLASHIEAKQSDPKMPQNLLWYSQFSEFPKSLLAYDEYLERVDTMLASGEQRMINGAIEAMQRTLGVYSEK